MEVGCPWQGPGRAHRERLRASQAVPLAIFIVVAVIFGTPSRYDRQEAVAQPPSPAHARVICAVHRKRRIFAAVSDPTRAGESRSLPPDCPPKPPPRARDAFRATRDSTSRMRKPETVRLGCVDCHGGNPTHA